MRHNFFNVATEGRKVNQSFEPGMEGFIIDYFKDLFKYKHSGAGFIQTAKLSGLFTPHKLNTLYKTIDKYYTNAQWLSERTFNTQPFVYSALGKVLPVNGTVESAEDLLELVNAYIQNREYIDSVTYSYLKEVEGFERRFKEELIDCYYLPYSRVFSRLEELKKAALRITPLHQRLDVNRLEVVGGKLFDDRYGIKFVPNMRNVSLPIKPLDAEGVMFMGAGIKNIIEVVRKESASDKLLNIMSASTLWNVAEELEAQSDQSDTTVVIDISSFAAKADVPKVNKTKLKEVSNLYHYDGTADESYEDWLYSQDDNIQHYLESVVESDLFKDIVNHLGAYTVYNNATAPTHQAVPWFEIIKAFDYFIAKSISK